jgi:hypothetical protein
MAAREIAKSTQSAPTGGDNLEVRWFDAWDSVLDQALRELPEMRNCPHELFRLLMTSPSPVEKRSALVCDRGRPVAVVGLRRRMWHWELATRGVVASCAMPALPEFLYPALAALRVHLWVYHQNSPPPDGFAQTVVPIQTYCLDCKSDFEAYWKESGLIRSIKRSRRLGERFTFEVDAPGSAVWAIRDWAARWLHSPACISASDFLVAAEYLQARKLLHSFWLLDEGRPVAARIMHVDGDGLVLACTSYLEEYRQHGVGVGLFEKSSQWATKAGYATVNLGGWHDYKAQWAPEGETIWTFSVVPKHVPLAKRVARACRVRIAAARRKFFAARQEPTFGDTT